MSEFLNVKEVADRLRVSEQTITRMYRAGALAGHKVGRQIRIPLVAVESYLALTSNQGFQEKRQ
jgi:excisionase family DNA binding protein